LIFRVLARDWRDRFQIHCGNSRRSAKEFAMRAISRWSKIARTSLFGDEKQKKRCEAYRKRFLRMESLEQRLVLAPGLPGFGFLRGNCDDFAQCACSNASTASNGSAMTADRSSGVETAYNSSTQPHPTITFNVHLDEPPGEAEYLKFSAAGDLTFDDTYFELPEETGWFTFTFQADAASLPSGRYAWDITYGYYDGEDDLITGTDDQYLAYQDVINLDNSQFGAGWQLTELDHLSIGLQLG
jgi:hypothetical protein